ncbi:MAG: KH domain-containing protein [Terrimicrobiaceae bacterium]|nr:KH domain-containing protein [Terrimicrobiaceae bacterium]
MEEFLRYVVGKLVEFPDELVITHAEAGDKTVFYLVMRPSDRPKVIGKGGHTIQALRNLLQASAQKKGIRVGLEIIE